MGTALYALGLVLIVEGLAWALAPSLVERLLEAVRMLGEDQRRMLGLASLAFGGVLVWVAFGLGV